MSIASEITRLQGVKSDILTAIGNKGVTVPEGSALDDCPGLINSIDGQIDLSKFVVGDIGQNFSSVGDLKWQYLTPGTGWFWTPSFDLTHAATIEEQWIFTIDSFETRENGSIGMGEWYNDNLSSKVELSIYIYSNRVIITYGGPVVTETFNVNYTLGTEVKVIKTINETIANIKILYGNTLVVDFSIARSSLVLGTYKFHIGGLRTLQNGYGFIGSIDFKHSYIKLDGDLVWGVDY